MDATKLLLLSAAAFFATLQSANCISCYSCTSSKPECVSFNSTAIDAINCDLYYPETSECIVYTATVRNETYTARGCAFEEDWETKEKKKISCSDMETLAKENNATLDSCRTCGEHMCNTAGLRGATWGVVLGAALYGFLGPRT